MKFFIKVLLFVGVVVFVNSCGSTKSKDDKEIITTSTSIIESTTVDKDGNEVTTITTTVIDGPIMNDSAVDSLVSSFTKVDKGVLLYKNVNLLKALLIVGVYGEAKKSGDASSVSQYKKLVSCTDHGFTTSQKIALNVDSPSVSSDVKEIEEIKKEIEKAQKEMEEIKKESDVSNIVTSLYSSNDSTCSSFDYANTEDAGSFTVEIIFGEK